EIIVNQKGELIDVIPMHTSGSDLLDFEAIQAVYRAAPFGPLTKHYPHEKLKIRAYFSYRISGQYIYGR
ncbi:MAG: TonB C-terminal domain-containing protein, partial [Desulfuromusa sp.]|nr:TonB C-terminal domain-containing protein [Desulfuromusa sp.]